MAIEPTTITASFFKKIMFLSSLLCSIIGATLFGYHKGVTGIKTVVREAVYEAVTPLKEQLADYKSRLDKYEQDRIETNTFVVTLSLRTNLTVSCLNNFLTSYNKIYNKEYVKPSDIKMKDEDDK